MNEQSAFIINEESHEKIVKENEEERRKELKRKKTNARQRAYYQRQKDLKKNEEIIKRVPKSNAERQRKFRQHKAEKSYMDIVRRLATSVGQSSHGADDPSLGTGPEEDASSSTDNPIADDEEEDNLLMAELPGMSETEDQTANGTSKKRKLEPEEPPPPAKKICWNICSECSKKMTKRVSWCIQCAMLLCMVCERSHAEHYVLRAPLNRPAGELEHVMSAIRPIVQHIVEATAAPEVSIEVNTDPLLVPKEEPDDEEMSIEIGETQLIHPNIVNYQMFSSQHTVTSATQSSQPMTLSQTVTSAPASQPATLSHPVTPTQAHSSSSQVPSRLYLEVPTLKQTHAIYERIQPKKSVENTKEKMLTVSDSEMMQTFETAPSSFTMSQTAVTSSFIPEQSGETSTRGFAEIALHKSGVINEDSRGVIAGPKIIEKENTDVSEFLVLSHNIKLEPDDPS